MDNVKRYANESWVGSPRGGNYNDADDNLIKENRDKVEVLAEVSDPDQDYSYDDTAVCYLEGHGYFLVQAAGCSCDGPEDTWSVSQRFATKEEILAAIDAGEYTGCTIPDYAIEEIRQALTS